MAISLDSCGDEKCKVLCNPSTPDFCPRVPVEALAQGLRLSPGAFVEGKALAWKQDSTILGSVFLGHMSLGLFLSGIGPSS